MLETVMQTWKWNFGGVLVRSIIYSPDGTNVDGSIGGEFVGIVSE